MPIARAREITLALAATALVGCGSVGRFDESPKHPVDLSGNWTINRTLSDDPKPAIDKLRPKPIPHRWDGPPPDENGDDTGPQQGGQQGGPGGGGGGGGGPGGGGRGRRNGQGQQAPQLAYRSNNEAYANSNVLKTVTADLARADNLTIQQSDTRFSIDYGSAVRNFTPGAVSVVSAAWGVADQSSGWKGKEFIIQVKPQQGVASTETFSLDNEGKHLIEEVHFGGGEFPSVKLKRVYDHTDHPLQRAVPMTD
jgi:hypothetical protein